jgi:allophanate hydrolase subunit 2
MAGLRVVGLSGAALFQDAGRQHIDSGVPVSGAFDRDAHAAATALLGGDIEQATLEIVGMIEVLPNQPMTCAVTGRATVTVDGRRAAPWTSLDVPAGARVSVHAEGRAYLGVAGGFQPAEVLGSRSTCLLGPIGPAPVGIGDLLPLAATCTSGTAGDFVRAPDRRPRVRVIPGPHLLVGASDVRVLEASRIGVRLTAGRLEGERAQVRSDLPSLGVLPGAVQVLPSGDWMLLGPDAGTMGGYPVAGVVATADLGSWAQVRVGEVVHLEVIDAGDAPDPVAPAVVRVHGLGG